jgi:hypothetical protein
LWQSTWQELHASHLAVLRAQDVSTFVRVRVAAGGWVGGGKAPLGSLAR